MASEPCPTCGLHRFPDIKPEKRASAPPPRPAKRPECDAPENVREVKMLLRRLSAECREARKRYYELRERWRVTPDDEYACSAGHVANVVEGMWAAEYRLDRAAAHWRAIKDAREAMPVAERWSLRDLEAWAAWPTAVS